MNPHPQTPNNEVGSDTPRTDAELNKTWKGIHAGFVPMAFARQLETELCREREAHNKTRAELEETEEVRDSWCEAYTEARDDLEATLNENQKLREILERYRVWATSENPTHMELDDLKQKYDELN